MVIIGDIEQLIDGFSSINLVIYGMTTAAVVILRVTHQKEQRLFKVRTTLPKACLWIAIHFTINCLTSWKVCSFALETLYSIV